MPSRLYARIMNTATRAIPITEAWIPALIESSPSVALTVRWSRNCSLAGISPAEMIAARSCASSIMKSPVIRTLPPGIGSLMFGADMMVSSSTMAKRLLVFARVVSKNLRAPLELRRKLICGRLASSLPWLALAMSEPTISGIERTSKGPVEGPDKRRNPGLTTPASAAAIEDALSSTMLKVIRPSRLSSAFRRSGSGSPGASSTIRDVPDRVIEISATPSGSTRRRTMVSVLASASAIIRFSEFGGTEMTIESGPAGLTSKVFPPARPPSIGPLILSIRLMASETGKLPASSARVSLIVIVRPLTSARCATGSAVSVRASAVRTSRANTSSRPLSTSSERISISR